MPAPDSVTPAFLILDPGLSSRRGHHYPLSHTLMQDAQLNGQSVELWCADDFESLSDLTENHKGSSLVRQIFSDAMIYDNLDKTDPIKRMDWWQAKAERLANEITNNPIPAANVVIVHTAPPVVALALTLWLNRLPEEKRPSVIANLMMPSGMLFNPETQTKSVYDPILLLQMQEVSKASEHLDCLHWVACSQSHANEYSVIFKREVPYWPLPLNRVSGEGIKNSHQILLAAGDAKEDKGFVRLPDLVIAIDKQISGFELVIHAALDPENAKIMSSFSRLQTLSLKRNKLRLETGFLADDAFNSLIQQSALVVLPYDSKTYKGQSSGLLWKILSFGRLAVVPNDTWLSSELNFWGAPLFTFAAAASDKDLANVIEKALVSKQTDQANIACKRFLKGTKGLQSVQALASVLNGEHTLRPPQTAPRLELGEIYRMGHKQSGQIFCKNGWHVPEATHCWSKESGAVLHFHLPEALPPSSYLFRMALNFIGQGQLEVRLRDSVLDNFAFTHGPCTIALPLEQYGIQPGRDVSLDLNLTFNAPVETGDERCLGVALVGIQLLEKKDNNNRVQEK